VEIVSQSFPIFSVFPRTAQGRSSVQLTINQPQLMDYETEQYRQQIIVVCVY
jgi:hypothetical protein